VYWKEVVASLYAWDLLDEGLDTVIRKISARFQADLQIAVDEALSRLGRDARVLVLPEAANTLPLPRFHAFPELEDLLPEGDAAIRAGDRGGVAVAAG
jgi:hypothetical protein